MERVKPDAEQTVSEDGEYCDSRYLLSDEGSGLEVVKRACSFAVALCLADGD